jgi:hypothetical protein
MTDIDRQYFANSLNYTAVQNTFSLTIRYLLSQFYNTSSEKRFTLKKDRSPLEITCTEYGDIEKYDLFIESNQLSGDEVLLLKAGREVVIYG